MNIEIMWNMEAVGAVVAVIGALLTANKRPLLGYPVMAASCVILCSLFITTGQTALLAMQAVFLLININGIWAWSRPGGRHEKSGV